MPAIRGHHVFIENYGHRGRRVIYSNAKVHVCVCIHAFMHGCMYKRNVLKKLVLAVFHRIPNIAQIFFMLRNSLSRHNWSISNTDMFFHFYLAGHERQADSFAVLYRLSHTRNRQLFKYYQQCHGNYVPWLNFETQIFSRQKMSFLYGLFF